MDTLRGNFEALDDSHGHELGEDESGRDVPPASIGQDERRMQVRAYNHWASLLEDRNFPAIDDLEPDNLPDFGPYSVLLDFTSGIENPGITYLGHELAQECDITVVDLQRLSDVPSRSLLSRITDHYMQILANQAPIGFEAEFVNQRGATILYRGILLPFSTDDETIDFIYGVINWKELADQHTSDELLLQVDQALEARPEEQPKRDEAPLTDWADGPGATPANDIDDATSALSITTDEYQFPTDDDFDDQSIEPAEGLPAFAGRAEDYLDAEDYEEESEDEDDEDAPGDDGLPRPRFGSLMSIGGGRAVAAPQEPDDDDDYSFDAAALPQEQPVVEHATSDFEYADDSVMALDGFEASHGLEDMAPADFAAAEDAANIPAGGEIILGEIDPADMELGDWLAAAREMAVQAHTSEDRTRNALYEAIGRAYDFSLAAAERPQDFEELLSDSGLTAQDRAPMTPVVKLVFGADYDKTRLTEYAAALSHAHRLELPRGGLTSYLRGAEGGLKGVVKAERQLRRAESGKTDPAQDSRELLAEKLRELPGIELADIAPYGSEFALLMIRRNEQGELVIVGEVPEDASLVEKAARRLVG